MRVSTSSAALLSGLCAIQGASAKHSTSSSSSKPASKTASSSSSSASAAATVGYDCYPNCITPSVSNSSLSFGQHYAVLNLDLITGLVAGVNTSAAGQAFINNTATWIDAVHAQDPAPLSIFTRIYFTGPPGHRAEVGANAPFNKISAGLGNASDPLTQLYPAFHVDEAAGDVVLQKTRYYAGAGNALEQILSTQGIDTVILSGIRTSGVITATTYRLFDLDYNV